MENEHKRRLPCRRNPNVFEVFAFPVHHFFLHLREVEVRYFFARESVAHIAALDLSDCILAVEQFSFDHYKTDGLAGFVEHFALYYEHLPGMHVFQVVSLNAVSDRYDRLGRPCGRAFARGKQKRTARPENESSNKEYQDGDGSDNQDLFL